MRNLNSTRLLLDAQISSTCVLPGLVDAEAALLLSHKARCCRTANIKRDIKPTIVFIIVVIILVPPTTPTTSILCGALN